MERKENKINLKMRRLFAKACVKYNLLNDGDKVLVALSGGKDSLALVKLMAEQKKRYKPQIEVEVVHVVMQNIPYKTDFSYIENFCRKLDVRLHILYSSFERREDSTKPYCFLCSWNRRKTIFSFAEKNGFNKVALGHHQDDILVTLLMNMFFEGSVQTMPPMLKMEYYPLSIIRPMCCIPENLIKQIATSLEFKSQEIKCPYENVTRRNDVEKLFKTIEAMNPEARYSLWRSMSNIKNSLLPRD